MYRRGLLVVGALGIAGILTLARAATAPPIGPELPVDAPALAGATGDQTRAAAAWDGQAHLIAWRSSLWRPELRASRLSAAGEVLDPRGIVLDGFERSDGTVAVAAGGGTFLVVWSKEPNRIFAARVSGDMVADAPLLVASGASDLSSFGPAVAWNGESFWVVWSQNGAGASVLGARVSAAGKLMDDVPIRIADGFGSPALAYDGARTLVVWTVASGAGLEVRGAHLERDGRMGAIGALFALDGKLPGPTAVAWNGSVHLVAAAGLVTNGGPAQIRGARVSREGMALDAGVTLAMPSTASAGGPAVAWTGTSFAALWAVDTMDGKQRSPRMAGAAISTEGAVSALPAAWTTAGAMPFLTAGDGGPLAVWSEVGWWTDSGTPEDLDVHAQRLGRDGAPAGRRVLVSRGTNAESEPVVAWSGERLLVAWEDRREDRRSGDIYAAILGADGTGSGGAFPVATGPQAQRGPAVAWDGHSFVVAWHEDPRGIGVARVGAAGVTSQIVAGTDGQSLLSDPALCADGDGALLVWARRAGTAPDSEIRGLRIPSDGPLGESFVLAHSTALLDPPAVRLGCNAHAALVLWSGDMDSTRRALFLGHLERGKKMLTPDPVVIQSSGADEGAGIGTDGEQFLVVWRQFDAGRRTVVGVRVNAAGDLLDQPALRIGTSNSGQRVSATWNGSEYVVLGVNTANGNPFDLRGRRVTSGGVGLDDDWWVVATLGKSWGGTGNGSDGVFAGGRAFIVYDRFFDEDSTGNVRVIGRFISAAPRVDGDVDAGADGGVDGGAADAGGPEKSPGGCGCRVGGAGGGGVPLLVASLLLVLLRRRSGSLSAVKRARS